MISKIFGNKTKYTYEIFQELHRELSFIYEITPKNEEEAVELVRSMTEALVWSEQNNQNYFDYFMKADVQNLFRRFLSFQSKPLLIQLIQSANMLVHNLDSEDNKRIFKIEYLLNTPFYGEVITHPYDSNDEEIVENYMSLLKSLATNLTSQQLKSYVLLQNFSLYTGAFAFIDSKDQMIKTAARTVILSIFKCKRLSSARRKHNSVHKSKWIFHSNCAVYERAVICLRPKNNEHVQFF